MRRAGAVKQISASDAKICCRSANLFNRASAAFLVLGALAWRSDRSAWELRPATTRNRFEPQRCAVNRISSSAAKMCCRSVLLFNRASADFLVLGALVRSWDRSAWGLRPATTRNRFGPTRRAMRLNRIALRTRENVADECYCFTALALTFAL